MKPPFYSVEQPQMPQDQYERFKLHYNINSPFVIDVKKEIAKGLGKIKEISDKITFLNDWVKIIMEDRVKHDLKKKQSDDDSHENKLTQFDHLIEHVEYLLSKYEPALDREFKLIKVTESKRVAKILMNGPPAVLGFLWHDFASKGYIPFPLRNGEMNYSAFSREILSIIDIKTSEANFANELNPKRNSLSNVKRQKFTIPELKDLA